MGFFPNKRLPYLHFFVQNVDHIAYVTARSPSELSSESHHAIGKQQILNFRTQNIKGQAGQTKNVLNPVSSIQCSAKVYDQLLQTLESCGSSKKGINVLFVLILTFFEVENQGATQVCSSWSQTFGEHCTTLYNIYIELSRTNLISTS